MSEVSLYPGFTEIYREWNASVNAERKESSVATSWSESI